MQITHVSSCPPNGGAARAALRQHEGLLAIGQDTSWLQANHTKPEVPNADLWSHRKTKTNFWQTITGVKKKRKKLKKAFSGATTLSSSTEGFGTIDGFQRFKMPDIYNFHWVSHFLDWEHGLLPLSQLRPIVWTLHDLNTTIGAWHYDPTRAENSSERQRINKEIWIKKRTIFQQIPAERILFAAPSKWIAERCRRSELTSKFRCVNIAGGLDIDIFSPVEKAVAKLAFGITEKTTIVGFIADSVDDPRKGMDALEAAIASLPNKQSILVLTVGRKQKASPNIQQINLGKVENDQILRQFYSACDLFVCPSTQDNLPNTVLESMACATPVIGSNIGGIPDMIEDGVTGLLTDIHADGALAAQINQLIENPAQRCAMGSACRQRIETDYNQITQAKTYLKLYEEVLQANVKG